MDPRPFLSCLYTIVVGHDSWLLVGQTEAPACRSKCRDIKLRQHKRSPGSSVTLQTDARVSEQTGDPLKPICAPLVASGMLDPNAIKRQRAVRGSILWSIETRTTVEASSFGTQRASAWLI